MGRGAWGAGQVLLSPRCPAGGGGGGRGQPEVSTAAGPGGGGVAVRAEAGSSELRSGHRAAGGQGRSLR